MDGLKTDSTEITCDFWEGPTNHARTPSPPRPHTPWLPKNVARNSPPDISDFEIRPLELQRLWAISKNDRVKLRATFAGKVTTVTLGPLYRPREPRQRLATTNSFTKNRRNHHENLQSAAPRPHGPPQNAFPRPSGARRTGGGGFAALETPPRRVAGVSHL